MPIETVGNIGNLLSSGRQTDAPGNVLSQSLFGRVDYQNVARYNSNDRTATQYGTGAIAQAAGSSAYGAFSLAVDKGCVAVGTYANSRGVSSVSIGDQSRVEAYRGIAVGFTANSRGLRSIAVGVKAYSSAQDTIAIGTQGRATAISAISIGNLSTVSGVSSIGIGHSITVAGASAVGIGPGVTSSSDQTIAIGNSAAATAAGTIAIGDGATVSTADSIGLGKLTSVAHAASVAIGRGSSSTAGNQFVSGATSFPINDVYFQQGVLASVPAAWVLHGTGGSGSNIAGGGVTIAGGQSTGSAAGGSLLFRTSPAGGAGSTLNALVTALTIDSTGLVTAAVNVATVDEAYDATTWNGSVNVPTKNAIRDKLVTIFPTDPPSGTYTPTLTNVANVAASTAYQCQYVRVGSTVVVSGKVDVDPTLTVTSTQLGISLPVASNLGTAQDCAGTAFCPTIAGQGAAILGDTTNDRAQMEWISGDVTNQPMYFTFAYEVI